MESVNPVCSKISSFFNYGGVSGKKLEDIKEEGVDTKGSYDTEAVGFLSLNCISSTDGIARSLFKQSANSGLSVTSEEKVGDGGMIDEVLERRKDDIAEYQEKVRSMGLNNIVTLKSASLKNIVCTDKIFLNNLSEKIHNTALFVFNLDPQEGETSLTGCKETRRSSVPPDKIIVALIPERYRVLIINQAEEAKIPLEKVIFVGDKEERISISYKDEEGRVPSCETPEPISVPNYESELRRLKAELGDRPIYTHMTRLPIFS